MDITKIVKSTGEDTYWVTYDGNARVLIKPLTPKKMVGLKKKCTLTRRKGSLRRGDLDEERFNELLNEEVIIDWEGFVVSDKNFPCTPENKIVLMDNSMEFNNFIQDAAVNIENYKTKKAEKAIKN